MISLLQAHPSEQQGSGRDAPQLPKKLSNGLEGKSLEEKAHGSDDTHLFYSESSGTTNS